VKSEPDENDEDDNDDDDDVGKFVYLPSGMAVRLKEEHSGAQRSAPAGRRRRGGGGTGARRSGAGEKRKRSGSTRSIEVFPDGVPGRPSSSQFAAAAPRGGARAANACGGSFSPPRKLMSHAATATAGVATGLVVSPVHQAGHGYARPLPPTPPRGTGGPTHLSSAQPVPRGPASSTSPGFPYMPGVERSSDEASDSPMAGLSIPPPRHTSPNKRGPGRPPVVGPGGSGPLSPGSVPRGRGRTPRVGRGPRGGGRGSRGARGAGGAGPLAPAFPGVSVSSKDSQQSGVHQQQAATHVSLSPLVQQAVAPPVAHLSHHLAPQLALARRPVAPQMPPVFSAHSKDFVMGAHSQVAKSIAMGPPTSTLYSQYSVSGDRHQQHQLTAATAGQQQDLQYSLMTTFSSSPTVCQLVSSSQAPQQYQLAGFDPHQVSSHQQLHSQLFGQQQQLSQQQLIGQQPQLSGQQLGQLSSQQLAPQQQQFAQHLISSAGPQPQQFSAQNLQQLAQLHGGQGLKVGHSLLFAPFISFSVNVPVL
jgi:hypothetical protein